MESRFQTLYIVPQFIRMRKYSSCKSYYTRKKKERIFLQIKRHCMKVNIPQETIRFVYLKYFRVRFAIKNYRPISIIKSFSSFFLLDQE